VVFRRRSKAEEASSQAVPPAAADALLEVEVEDDFLEPEPVQEIGLTPGDLAFPDARVERGWHGTAGGDCR
jgi:hypothetical protein